jgi:hypothetical protein
MRYPWRLAVASLLLAACTQSSRGPAWPKASDKSMDGGESLAPHKASPLDDKSDDDDDVIVMDDKPDKTEKPASKSEDKPAATGDTPKSPTITAPDDILNVDDIIIDIDD